MAVIFSDFPSHNILRATAFVPQQAVCCQGEKLLMRPMGEWVVYNESAMTSFTALKEWAVVVDALGHGEQLLVVRKGGIRDPKGSFDLQHREFLLYPTREHQHEEAVRPEFRERFQELPRISPSATVRICIYAGVAFCGEIRDPKPLAALTRYHIWTPEFFEERMRYKPASPTLVVVVRAYRLKNPIDLSVEPHYAGCKSWVPLEQPVEIGETIPVVENQRFRKALEEISGVLTPAGR